MDVFFDIEEAMDYLNKRASDMVDMAKDKAPIAKEPYPEFSKGKRIMRQPGRLKKNIKKKGKKNSIKVYVDMGTRGAPYALYQEVGFKNHLTGKVHPGKHFMEEALEAVLTDMDRDGIMVAERCLKIQTSNGRELKIYR